MFKCSNKPRITPIQYLAAVGRRECVSGLYSAASTELLGDEVNQVFDFTSKELENTSASVLNGNTDEKITMDGFSVTSEPQ